MDLIEGSDSSDDEEIINDNNKHVLTDKTDQSAASSLKRSRVDVIAAHSHEASALFVRTVPHVRGNWAGHVFCKVSRSPGSSVFVFRRELERVGWSGTLVAHDDLHISLSRPFFLQEANIDSFVRELRHELAGVPRTNLRVTNHIVLVNDNGTRSFWCWALSTSPTMLRIIASIDLVLAKYQQPTYYQPPKFHVSLASIPGLVPSQFLANTSEWNNEDTLSGSDDETESSTVRVDHVVCTLGTTKRFCFQL
jgi:U6 snRNA phosphodiesterase